MTERAKRAAAELTNRGWSMDEGLNKSCAVCHAEMATWMRYCPTCGAKVPTVFAAGSLADLEAALVAAESA